MDYSKLQNPNPKKILIAKLPKHLLTFLLSPEGRGWGEGVFYFVLAKRGMYEEIRGRE
jgi:hypothetical protein